MSENPNYGEKVVNAMYLVIMYFLILFNAHFVVDHFAYLVGRSYTQGVIDARLEADHSRR